MGCGWEEQIGLQRVMEEGQGRLASARNTAYCAILPLDAIHLLQNHLYIAEVKMSGFGNEKNTRPVLHDLPFSTKNRSIKSWTSLWVICWLAAWSGCFIFVRYLRPILFWLMSPPTSSEVHGSLLWVGVGSLLTVVMPEKYSLVSAFKSGWWPNISLSPPRTHYYPFLTSVCQWFISLQISVVKWRWPL